MNLLRQNLVTNPQHSTYKFPKTVIPPLAMGAGRAYIAVRHALFTDAEDSRRINFKTLRSRSFMLY